VVIPGISTIFTNLVINVGLRPGLEKVTFVRTDFESLLGQAYFPQTNFYTDQVISNFSIPQFVRGHLPDLLLPRRHGP
jgi:hypothetical protein